MKYTIFSFGILIATFLAASLIPGLDILAWHLLQPIGFWQKIILIAIEAITAWPRIFIGACVWTVIVSFFSAIAD